MLSTLNLLGLLLPLLTLLTLGTPLTTPIPSDNTIQLGFGTKPVNIGSLWNSELRDALTKTLRTACPDATQEFCGVVPAGIIANAAFPVYAWAAKKRPVNADDLVSVVVEIESMRWNANREIYDILMDAVASAASLATAGNCNEYAVGRPDGEPLKYTFCNTVDRVNVVLPGSGGGHAFVTLKSKGVTGYAGMDCWRVRETAGQGVVEMEGRIARAVGKGEGEVYTASRCIQ